MAHVRYSTDPTAWAAISLLVAVILGVAFRRLATRWALDYQGSANPSSLPSMLVTGMPP